MTSSLRKDIECEIACSSPILFAVAKETKKSVFLVNCLQSQSSNGSNVELFKNSNVLARFQEGKGDLIFFRDLFSRPFTSSFIKRDEVIPGRMEKNTELSMDLYPLMAVIDSFLSSKRYTKKSAIIGKVGFVRSTFNVLHQFLKTDHLL